MSTARVVKTALAAVAVALATSAAHTQPAPPPPAERGAPPDREAMKARWQERQAMRAKALHDILAIHPDQEAAFQAFLAAMRPSVSRGGEAADKRDDRQASSDQPMTALQRMDAALRRFDEHVAKRRAALQARAGTVRTFYAVLNPEQRRAFDALDAFLHRDSHGFTRGRMDFRESGEGD